LAGNLASPGKRGGCRRLLQWVGSRTADTGLCFPGILRHGMAFCSIPSQQSYLAIGADNQSSGDVEIAVRESRLRLTAVAVACCRCGFLSPQASAATPANAICRPPETWSPIADLKAGVTKYLPGRAGSHLSLPVQTLPVSFQIRPVSRPFGKLGLRVSYNWDGSLTTGNQQPSWAINIKVDVFGKANDQVLSHSSYSWVLEELSSLLPHLWTYADSLHRCLHDRGQPWIPRPNCLFIVNAFFGGSFLFDDASVVDPSLQPCNTIPPFPSPPRLARAACRAWPGLGFTRRPPGPLKTETTFTMPRRPLAGRRANPCCALPAATIFEIGSQLPPVGSSSPSSPGRG